MRLSAKLNVFLGVLNLGEAFVPPHLKYLISFMRKRRMNALMPVSLLGGLALVAWLTQLRVAPGVSAFHKVEYAFLIGMAGLAVLEHAMLVLPLPFTALWGIWLRKEERVFFFAKDESPSGKKQKTFVTLSTPLSPPPATNR
jgi:putative photosynthetic complex assembly protein 2